MNKKPKRKHLVLKIVLLILLLLVLAAGCVVFYFYRQFHEAVGQINYRELETEKLVINENVKEDESLHGFINIALFGLDTREGDLEQANSDAIIVASINNDSKTVKLVSVYRDTYLYIGGDMYRKANAAYANGGPEWAVSMLNSNLDLDITEFVSVDFDALVDLIDVLGGIELTIDEDECVHLNNYCVETSEVTGKEYEELPGAGTYLMNGVQAVAYTRIRFTAGNDFKRTERQRVVIETIVEKAKNMSLGELESVCHDIFPEILTSFSEGELIELGSAILSYRITETTGFPFSHRTSPSGDNEIAVTLEENVKELHKYLFDEESYEPSETVQIHSQYIINETGYGEDTAASTENFTTQE